MNGYFQELLDENDRGCRGGGKVATDFTNVKEQFLSGVTNEQMFLLTIIGKVNEIIKPWTEKVARYTDSGLQSVKNTFHFTRSFFLRHGTLAQGLVTMPWAAATSQQEVAANPNIPIITLKNNVAANIIASTVA